MSGVLLSAHICAVSMRALSTGVAWCPPTSTYFNQIQVGTGKNGTSAAKAGPGPNQWTWSDMLIIVPMDTKTLTVAGGGSEVPVSLTELLTPFGKTPPIGNATTTYSNFKAAADASADASAGDAAYTDSRRPTQQEPFARRSREKLGVCSRNTWLLLQKQKPVSYTHLRAHETDS